MGQSNIGRYPVRVCGALELYRRLFEQKVLNQTGIERKMPTYQGRCHCGNTRFEIEGEIETVRECDCSVCRRRGALIFRVASDKIRFLTPLDNLSIYRWGTGTGVDYFCATCGIMPFRRPSAPTGEEQETGKARFDGWAVNVRCINDLSLDLLTRVRIRGSDLKI
jgi:hypothetical protein